MARLNKQIYDKNQKTDHAEKLLTEENLTGLNKNIHDKNQETGHAVKILTEENGHCGPKSEALIEHKEKIKEKGKTTNNFVAI